MLTLINVADWDKNNKFWTFVYKEKPLRNYDTVRNIDIQKYRLIQEIDWNENNSNALEEVIFDQPKITKQIIKAMCLATGVEFMGKEKEINFFKLLEELVKIGLQGAKFICEKVKLNQELDIANDLLLETIEELKGIAWQVNTKLKS